MSHRFVDRREAGRRLAELLTERLAGLGRARDVVVLALPRGGVPVGYEVARRLGAPLDVFVVRKLGVPGREELAMGAIATGGVRVLDRDVLRELEINEEQIALAAAQEQLELERREQRYREGRPAPRIRGRTAVLVDDGLATGSTMRAAIAALRIDEPAHIIVAVPIAAAETCDAIRPEVDDVVCAVTPEPFRAVGLWYDDFAPTGDEEVRALLAEAERELGSAAEPLRDVPGGG